MALTLTNRARLIRAAKDCIILAGNTPMGETLISFVNRGMPWSYPLPPELSNVVFHELKQPTQFVLSIIEAYADDVAFNLMQSYPHLSHMGLKPFTLLPKDIITVHLSRELSGISINCASLKTDRSPMSYISSSKTLTINSDFFMNSPAGIMALYPFSLLHEFCHAIQPCVIEKQRQEGILGREASDQEFQLAAHCFQFKAVLLTLSYHGKLIRQALYHTIQRSITNEPQNYQDLSKDPYAWEYPIRDVIVEETLDPSSSKKLPMVVVQGAASLDSARARFLARPNDTPIRQQSLGVDFKGLIISLGKERNLLKSAHTKYALNLLVDIYTAPVPSRKSVIETTIPALIAIYDNEVKTLRFFYTDGLDPFFEVTSTEAFWLLDFFGNA